MPKNTVGSNLLEVTVYRGNSPAKGVRVSAKGASFTGGFTSEERTDSSGRAYIKTEHSAKYIVYVDGKGRGEYRSPGRHAIHL